MGWHLAGFACDSGKADARARRRRATASLGRSRPPKRSRASSASSASTAPRLEHARRRDAHDSMCSTCATPPNTQPAMSPARSRRLAASWCRRPTTMPARSARASCCRDDKRGARGDDGVVAQADGLARRVRAARKRAMRTGGPGRIVLGTPTTTPRSTPSAAISADDDRDRSVAQPGLSARPYSGRLVRHPLAARPRIVEDRPARTRWCSPARMACSASLAVAEAQALTHAPVHWLKGGNAAWRAAGLPLSTRAHGRRADRRLAQAL